jgi:hypothetical protein
MAKVAVRFDAGGVQVSSGGRGVEFAWSAVERVRAYKQDLFTVDLICLAFDLDRGMQATIHEECSAYDALVDALPTYFPGARSDWWPEVAHPAFAECPTVVWEREAAEGQRGRSPSSERTP